MLVYRVGCKTVYGAIIGPYRFWSRSDLETPEDIKVMIEEHNDDQETHEAPSFMDVPANDVFGFLYAEDVYTWFDDFVYTLRKYGFCIYTYEIPEDIITFYRNQISFPEGLATLVWTESI